MLTIYSLIIIFICLIPIFLISRHPVIFKKNLFQNHLIIFSIKLIIISMFIYIFISKFSISNIQLFIIIGCCIVVVCHFIEGFVLQNILSNNEQKK
jgi:hypothetical protein